MNKDYHSAKREVFAGLSRQFPDGWCFITSVDTPGKNIKAGAVCSVTVDNAARCIVEGSHRLATDEEARAFRESQTAARAYSRPAVTLAAARDQFTAIMKERSNAK